MTQVPRQTLTSPEGPVVISEKTLRALAAIRRLPLLAKLFGQVAIARSVYEAVDRDLRGSEHWPPPWLVVEADRPDQTLPARVASASPSDTATLQLAVALPASLVLIDGPVKDHAKLSAIKSEGTVALLVQAYREGHLSAVRPMVKALRALGHEDVIPPAEMLDALWTALDKLET